jgi:hypothetical protein
MSKPADETLLRVTTLVGTAFGVAGVLAPDALGDLYGIDDHSPANRLMTRLWGGRTALVGVLTLLASPGDNRRTLLVALAAQDALDTLSALAADGLSSRARNGAAATTATFAVVTAYLATRE